MNETIADKPRRALDAIELLMQDHREVESLLREFESLEKGDEDQAADLIEGVCTELEILDRLSTEILYPAVRKSAGKAEIGNLLDQAEDRHDAVRKLIKKLDEMDSHDDKVEAQFTVLADQVKHHVEQEETKLYREVKTLKGLDLIALADEMKARKAELMAEMGLAAEGV